MQSAIDHADFYGDSAKPGKSKSHRFFFGIFMMTEGTAPRSPQPVIHSGAMSPAVRVLLTLEVLEPRCTLRLRTKMRGFEAHSVETELRTYLKTRASRERAATQHPIPSLVSRYGPDVEQCQERNWKERGTVGVVGYPFFLLPQPPTRRARPVDASARETAARGLSRAASTSNVCQRVLAAS